MDYPSGFNLFVFITNPGFQLCAKQVPEQFMRALTLRLLKSLNSLAEFKAH
jgi:hypothetical protein